MADYPRKPKNVSEFGKFLYKSQEEIRAVQNDKLKNQMALLEKYSPYYSKKFKEWGMTAGDVQNLLAGIDLELPGLLATGER